MYGGKDPIKVDRSGAYMMQYIAKNIIAAELADKCTLSISYAIGVADPILFMIYLHGIGKIEEGKLEIKKKEIFDLKSKSIINTLIKEYKGKVAYWSNFASIYGEMKFTLMKDLNLNINYHHMLALQKAAAGSFPGGTDNTRGDLIIAKLIYNINNLGESIEIFQKLKNDKGLVKCSNIFGTIYGEIGDFRKAKSCFEESLDLANRSDDNELLGMAELNLGIISGIFADYQKSKDYFNKALKYFEKTGEKMRIAEIYNNLGLMNYNAGNLGISLDEYNRSIKICLEINYFQLLGISFLGKATTYLKLGNLQLAAALSDKAMTICNKSGDRLTVADIYKVKGIIERESSRYNESENLLKTSLMINRELGNKLNEAETSVKLGRWFILLNEKKKSKEMFRNALAYYKNQGSDKKISEILDLV